MRWRSHAAGQWPSAGASPRPPADHNGISAIGLDKQHTDLLVVGGRQVLAHVIGPDWKFSVAPIDQHGELYRPGAAVVAYRVQCRPDGAAGAQHVIDQHNQSIV